MTISGGDERLRIYWSIGFAAYFMFLPIWIRFTTNILVIKSKIIKIIMTRVLIITSLVFVLFCVMCADVEFVQTIAGNQFTYNNSMLMRITVAYVIVLSIIVFLSHFWWWRQAKLQRHRKQQSVFMLLTIIFAPLGFFADFYIPTFTDVTIAPLCSVILIPAGLQLFISMRIDQTLSITVQNVSKYIFKTTSSPILVLGHDNIINIENNAAKGYFGENLIGTEVCDVIKCIDPMSEISSYDIDISGKTVMARTPSGQRLCDMIVSVETDKYGDAICKVVILRDITENVELIRSLRKTSEKLEEALVQARAASKAKSDFLSNMSHEMRTPLNAVIGMATIGKANDDLSSKHLALGRIADASSHLLGVINDVLDMAKIEADKLELTLAPFRFSSMINKMLSIAGFRVDEKKQLLSIYIDEKIPEVIIGDEQRLTQVVTNILTNAIKFTPDEGSIRVDAILEDETEDYCTLRIEVTDTGIGISPEQQSKVFEAFEQVDGGISRDYGGTGLGLVICKRIIELMGGKIWIESEVGEGARFIFTANVLRGSIEEISSEFVEGFVNSASLFGERENFVGKRLLIVEDIELNREIVIAMLENTGIIIDYAENGKKALDKIAEFDGEYDIVFMDMQMPQMDGLEATRRIRALGTEYTSNLPIVAMTANVFSDDIDACLRAGMNEHLGKPLEFDKIMEVLREHLK